MFITSDIDECALGLDGCENNCTNTVGAYFCSCVDGYALQGDNITCRGMRLSRTLKSLIYRLLCMHVLIQLMYVRI